MSAESGIWGALPLGPGVRLLCADSAGAAALDKPAGILSHPNVKGDEPRSLLTTAYTAEGECYQWQDGTNLRRLWLLNRLDASTSGVVLVCAGEALARQLRELFRQKRVHKIYEALVFGRPQSVVQLWRDRLAVRKEGGHIRTAAGGNIPAVCRMSQLRAAGDRALLRLEPLTGRSHQLRVQCARRHLPIIGDATYGDFDRNRRFARATGHKRMFLHSLETAFEYEHMGRQVHFSATAPLPVEFDQALQGSPRP